MYAPSSGWYSYEVLNDIFAAHDVRPTFVQHLGQSLTLLSLVNAGEGMALVPASAQQICFP